jgi:hypothetical protein
MTDDAMREAGIVEHEGGGVMHEEPIMDMAHLGHRELLTPKPEESLRFFVDVMGMTGSDGTPPLPGQHGDEVVAGMDDLSEKRIAS